jgi:hypothetical protein
MSACIRTRIRTLTREVHLPLHASPSPVVRVSLSGNSVDGATEGPIGAVLSQAVKELHCLSLAQHGVRDRRVTCRDAVADRAREVGLSTGLRTGEAKGLHKGLALRGNQIDRYQKTAAEQAIGYIEGGVGPPHRLDTDITDHIRVSVGLRERLPAEQSDLYEEEVACWDHMFKRARGMAH